MKNKTSFLHSICIAFILLMSSNVHAQFFMDPAQIAAYSIMQTNMQMTQQQQMMQNQQQIIQQGVNTFMQSQPQPQFHLNQVPVEQAPVFTLTEEPTSPKSTKVEEDAEPYQRRCHLCGGSGKCNTCNGTHRFINPLTGDWVTCPNCKPDGRCSHCKGSGKN